jgi:predicted outer membrane protein
LVFVIGWSSLLFAQEKAEKKDIPDRGFMMSAARDGIFHVESGKLAVQRGSSEGVKKFGQHAIEHLHRSTTSWRNWPAKRESPSPKR